MPNTYVIKVETTDKDGVISSELLTKAGKTYMVESLADACEAAAEARKWVKGRYIVCILKDLQNVEID
jgi:hypothetical protein